MQRMLTARRGAVGAAVVLAAAAVLAPATDASAHGISPAAAHPAAADESTPVLAAGQSLHVGQSLTSSAGGFQLVMQPDGNLVEYLTTAQRPVWASRTSCTTDPEFVMQTDGNAVLYCAGTALFATSTSVPQDSGEYPNEFAVSVDGDMAVYNEGSGKVLWESGAVTPGDAVFADLDSDNGIYHWVMQADGNLVLYSTRGTPHALWASGTNGFPGSFVALQQDGNIVVYSQVGPRWASGTGGSEAADLVVQDDGNVVLYEINPAGEQGAPVWATGTAGRQ